MSVPDGAVSLYAQWSDAADLAWERTEEGVTVTGYHGADGVAVIPELMDRIFQY